MIGDLSSQVQVYSNVGLKWFYQRLVSYCSGLKVQISLYKKVYYGNIQY